MKLSGSLETEKGRVITRKSNQAVFSTLTRDEGRILECEAFMCILPNGNEFAGAKVTTNEESIRIVVMVDESGKLRADIYRSVNGWRTDKKIR